MSLMTDPGFTPSRGEMLRAIGLFKVLSHPDRLRLACALGDGRTTTQTRLMKEFGWPQSTAARHITALRNAGIVAAERSGTEVHLRLGNPVALHRLETVCSFVHQPSADENADVSLTDVVGASARLWPSPTPVGTPEEGHYTKTSS